MVTTCTGNMFLILRFYYYSNGNIEILSDVALFYFCLKSIHLRLVPIISVGHRQWLHKIPVKFNVLRPHAKLNTLNGILCRRKTDVQLLTESSLLERNINCEACTFITQHNNYAMHIFSVLINSRCVKVWMPVN